MIGDCAALAAGAPIAVAVSGGPDSMALTLVAAAWAKTAGHPLTALTVDHGLRPESAAEAAQVGRWLKARGIAHHVLHWRGEKPSRNIQAAARDARYDLLAKWCRRHRVAQLVLAHTQDDQAETVLLRAGRGSGVDGLCGMWPASARNGITLLRPLLGIPKARLIATLTALGQPWIEDPSNRNPAFQRVQVRTALQMLAPAGLAPKRLAETAIRMQRLQPLLASLAADVIARAVSAPPAGHLLVDHATLAALPVEIASRVLASLLTRVSGQNPPPRYDSLSDLAVAISATNFSKKTLHGCVITIWRKQIALTREPAKAGPAVPLLPGRTAVWDARWALTWPKSAPIGCHFGPLGAGRAAWLRRLNLPSLPPTMVPVLPAIWQKETVVALPSLNWAENCASLPAAALSRVD